TVRSRIILATSCGTHRGDPGRHSMTRPADTTRSGSFSVGSGARWPVATVAPAGSSLTSTDTTILSDGVMTRHAASTHSSGKIDARLAVVMFPNARIASAGSRSAIA